MARRSATTAAAGSTTATTSAATTLTSTTTTTTTTTSTATTTTPKANSGPSSASSATTWNAVLANVVNYYQKDTPQRTKMLDAFLAFLVVVGGLQFVYCVLAGNYPFNAFLSGFSSTVGQFVLTVSLRIQTTEANKTDFPSVSPERAFADYIVCSLILHFFCVNFIN
ncbi:oligosaccharyl transferase subunit [Grosmannia clavigera kw1407]|uniref:Dolichyl-diphosphooligosaccharide--protein glycosyltransferase subunit OST2 n=1 Tax=Grosmannia clavigera (strain kw1407 / UAMH 11150) TaxID=655863 RepID=F0X935_GROCL|nr:oligosaccharyl transferase subunit [Grosmannia clavigera kw1407]EFX05315.1 oligosaccharyl transferase subunit [Grosmannia clavigera kw1407]